MTFNLNQIILYILVLPILSIVLCNPKISQKIKVFGEKHFFSENHLNRDYRKPLVITKDMKGTLQLINFKTEGIFKNFFLLKSSFFINLKNNKRG